MSVVLEPVPSTTSAEPTPRLEQLRPLGLCLLLAVPLGAGLMPFHLAALFLLPLVLLWHRRQSSVVVVAWCAVLGVAQVLSDVANRTSPSSTIAELVLLSGLVLPALTIPWLVNADPARWEKATLLSMVALVIYGLVSVVLTALGTLPTADLVWKFALGAPAIIAVTVPLGWLWVRGHRAVVPLVVFALGVLSLLLGFRSLAAESLVAAVALFALLWVRPTRRSLITIFVLAVLALAGGQSFYYWAAGNGHLGQEAKVRFEHDTSTTSGPLLSSRPDFVISSMLIEQQPILGYGSNPVLTDSQVMQGRAELLERKIGFTEYIRERMLGEFQSHSTLFGTWVRAGLVGAVAVLGIWFWIIRRVWKLLLAEGADTRLVPFLVAVIPTITWELAFSPVNPGIGVLCGLTIAAIQASQHPDARSFGFRR